MDVRVAWLAMVSLGTINVQFQNNISILSLAVVFIILDIDRQLSWDLITRKILIPVSDPTARSGSDTDADIEEILPSGIFWNNNWSWVPTFEECLS